MTMIQRLIGTFSALLLLVAGMETIAAGGTGGHMFPAEALAREMAARGGSAEHLVGAARHAGADGVEERVGLDVRPRLAQRRRDGRGGRRPQSRRGTSCP